MDDFEEIFNGFPLLRIEKSFEELLLVYYVINLMDLSLSEFFIMLQSSLNLAKQFDLKI